MSEEEKKAIEELKKVRWCSLAIVVKNEDGKMDISYFTEKHKKTILNLIEKQQKEIKELEKDNNHQWEERCRLTFDIEKNFISKDKIREKIKEYKGLKEIDKMAYEEQIKPLQELLEEE